MPLSASEARLAAAVEARRDDLLALLGDLIAHDTTTWEPGAPPRAESALQGILERRLAAAGARTDLWEPAPDAVAGSRQVPDGWSFEGRPQLLATFPGAGGGASLLLNGHVDTVSVEPRDAWSSDPFAAEVRDGLLYGRGACDMKGGVAAMVLAAEVLAAEGVRLRGDLLVSTVTDEESTGAGAIAAVARGARADAGLVPEATSFGAWVAVRGALKPTVTVRGRAGHAGIAQPHWREGGAVNAIEKAALVQEALRRLHGDWQQRDSHRHPHLSPPHVRPVTIAGGEWIVSIPAECTTTYHVTYLPDQADGAGWGAGVEAEVEACIAEACAADDWLAEHPPRIVWAKDIPPGEVPVSEPIVGTALGAVADVGRDGGLAGLDSWYDGATFTAAGTPTIAVGPRRIEIAHTIDEHVPVDDLVATAQVIAVTAMRFCGVA